MIETELKPYGRGCESCRGYGYYLAAGEKVGCTACSTPSPQPDQETVERVARAISKVLANIEGGCFRPEGRSQRGECADGDCYCARVTRHCAREALASIAPQADVHRGEVEKLREVVRQCGERFREYEAAHRSKVNRLDRADRATLDRWNAEANAKADRNRNMAELCEAALSTPAEQEVNRG